jgi:hypothetical protein
MVYAPSTRLRTDGCVGKEDGVTECSFTVGSWTHHSSHLKLMSSGILFYIYRQHPKYEIVALSDVQDLDKHPCCVEK